MKFDDYFSSLNDWGRYQKTKYLFICLSYMLPSIMVYQYSFSAGQPSFRCLSPSPTFDRYDEQFNLRYNEQFQPTEGQCRRETKRLSLRECQRCFRRSPSSLNSSGDEEQHLERCSKFVFDRSIYLSTLTEEWTMVCDRVIYRSWIQMIFFFGYMCGSIFFGILADRYGRRPVMGASFVLMSLSSLICALTPGKTSSFAYSYSIFILGRFLLACSTRGVSVSGFVLSSEIVGPSRRLLTGIVIEYFFAFGQFILLIFAFWIRRWRTLTWSLTLFTLPYLSFYFLLPESPRWLLTRGRFDRVEEVCRGIARTNRRTFDPIAFEKMKEEQRKLNERRGKESSGVKTLFQSRSMSLISINLFFQWLVQNLVFYGVSQNTGSWQLNPYLSFGLSALVELLAYIFVHLILDRLGRKKPYCFFVYLFSFFSFLLIPIDFFLAKDHPIRSVLISSINLLLKFCASASYSIIYIYANELFPTNVRNTGMGICSMVARIGAILGTFANDSLSRVWLNLPLIVYGSLSLFAGLLSLMFPETLNHSLPQTVDDVEQMIRNKKCPTTNNNDEKEEMTRF